MATEGNQPRRDKDRSGEHKLESHGTTNVPPRSAVRVADDGGTALAARLSSKVDKKLIADLIKGYTKPEDIIGENGPP